MLIAWPENTFKVRLLVKDDDEMEACCHTRRVNGEVLRAK